MRCWNIRAYQWIFWPLFFGLAAGFGVKPAAVKQAAMTTTCAASAAVVYFGALGAPPPLARACRLLLVTATAVSVMHLITTGLLVLIQFAPVIAGIAAISVFRG